MELPCSRVWRNRGLRNTILGWPALIFGGDGPAEREASGPACASVEEGALEAFGGDEQAEAGGTFSAGFFQNAFEAANVAKSAFEQAGGSGMPIDGVAVGQCELAGNESGTAPFDKFEFDEVTIGVAADAASAAMLGGWFGCCHGNPGRSAKAVEIGSFICVLPV
jgi:hypothetical protein